MAIKKMIDLRKNIKSKKPKGLRRNFGIKKRLSKKWRKPKGLQNKVRLNKKGYGKPISSGYGSPKEVKHLDAKTGLFPLVISCKSDLDKVDPKTQGVLISSRVGAKKRLELLDLIEKKNLTLIQDSKKLKNKIQSKLEDKKKSRKKIKDRRLEQQKKKKEAQKKKDKKKEEDKKENKENSENKKDKNDVSDKSSSTHDNVKTKKALEADKANKEILQKKL
jgi:large subunit ribosomal protein L32e